MSDFELVGYDAFRQAVWHKPSERYVSDPETGHPMCFTNTSDAEYALKLIRAAEAFMSER